MLCLLMSWSFETSGVPSQKCWVFSSTAVSTYNFAPLLMLCLSQKLGADGFFSSDVLIVWITHSTTILTKFWSLLFRNCCTYHHIVSNEATKAVKINYSHRCMFFLNFLRMCFPFLFLFCIVRLFANLK